jgi:hypothetical protein
MESALDLRARDEWRATCDMRHAMELRHVSEGPGDVLHLIVLRCDERRWSESRSSKCEAKANQG